MTVVHQQVHRLDLRGADADRADRLAESLLWSVDERTAGVVVLTTPDNLVAHTSACNRLLNSPQEPPVVVVLLGGLDRRRQLKFTGSFLEHGRVKVLWVSDPGGVLWSSRANAVPRVSDVHGSVALEVLLSTLSVPSIFLSVLASGDEVAAPGLELAGRPWDASTLTAALAESLAEVARHRGSDAVGVARNDRSPWGRLLQPAGSASVLREGGRLSRLASEISAATDDITLASASLTRLTGLFSARASAAVSEAARGAAAALESLRSGALDLRRDVREPGGPLRPDVVLEKCQQYGLDPGPADTATTLDLSRAVADMVRGGLAAGASLADLNRQLEQRLVELGVGSNSEYVEAVEVACPDRLLVALRSAPDCPPLPVGVAAVGLLIGGLAAAGPALVPALFVGLFALGMWTGMLSSWPGSRLLSVGLPALFAALGVAAGAGVARLLAPSAAVWMATVGAALALAVLVPFITWRQAATAWLTGVPTRAAEPAAAEIVALVERTVRTEWSALNSRVVAADVVISAQAVIHGTAEILNLLAAQVRTAVPARSSADSDTLRYWREIADTTVQGVLVNILSREWGSLCSGSGVEVRRRLERAFGDFLEIVTQRGGDILLVDYAPGYAAIESLLDDETARTIVQVVRTDAADPIRQFTAPDDVGVLSGRPERTAVVRFAPGILPPGAVAELPSRCVPTGRSGLAGVLRLTGLREGIVA